MSAASQTLGLFAIRSGREVAAYLREGYALRLTPAQVLILSLLIAYAAIYVFWSAPFDAQSRGADFSAYWNAAERLREGQLLYPPLVDQQANDVYRYAAWFAYLWLPFTFFPREVVETAWIALLFASSLYLLLVMLESRTFAAICLCLLVGPWLFENAWVGQVHTLLVACLTISLERRSGPVVVGMAASLKLSPLAFAAWYVFNRKWAQAAIALAVFVGMSATTFAFDLTHYPTDASEISLAAESSVLWELFFVALCVSAVWVAIHHPKYRLLALGAVAALGLPRVHQIYASI